MGPKFLSIFKEVSEIILVLDKKIVKDLIYHTNKIISKVISKKEIVMQ